MFNNIFLKTRLLIRSNPILYKYFLFFRNKKGYEYFPDKNTDFQITGYPRSANTFASDVLKEFFSKKNNYLSYSFNCNFKDCC